MARPRKQAEITTAAEIYQDEHGIWHGWVEFPSTRTDANGKKIRDRRQRKGKDEKKVRAKVAALEKLRDEKKSPPVGGGLTVQQWFTEWLTDIAPFGEDPLAPSTLADYWSKCRTWVFPHLGHLLLDALDTDDLDALYKAMRKAKSSRGKPLAGGTILKVHAIIRRGLGVAIPRKKIMSRINVAALIDNPAKPARGRQDVETSDGLLILDALVDHPNALRWKIGLATGPRQGTALAIRWAFVDFDTDMIDMAWQVQRRTWQHGCDDPHACGERLHLTRCPGTGLKHNRDQHAKRDRGCPPPCTRDCVRHASSCPARHSGGIVFARPKGFTDNDSSHWVAIPNQLMVELAALKKEQDAWIKDLGTAYEKNDLVFCQKNGHPIGQNADRAELRRILDAANLSHRGTHWLRHFAATYVVEQGEAVEVAQEMLNHKDPNLTRRVYARNAKGLTQRGAARMQGLLEEHGAKRGASLATPPATPENEEAPGQDRKAS